MSEIPNQPPIYNQPPPYQPPGYNQQVPPGGYQQYPPQNGYQNFPPPPGGYSPYGAYMGPINHSDASAAQTCGIIGIVLFFNLIGIILNIIAIVKGNNVMRDYENFPGRFTESSYSKAKTGRTCGIIGLSLLGLGVLVVIVGVVISSL
jgi:hypothetical protein